MSQTYENRPYYDLEITGTADSVDIWLGDDGGSLVQKERGVLRTSLLQGNYVVEFGLGTACYPIRLDRDSRFTQHELEAGRTCQRPVFTMPSPEQQD